MALSARPYFTFAPFGVRSNQRGGSVDAAPEGAAESTTTSLVGGSLRVARTTAIAATGTSTTRPTRTRRPVFFFDSSRARDTDGSIRVGSTRARGLDDEDAASGATLTAGAGVELCAAMARIPEVETILATRSAARCPSGDAKGARARASSAALPQRSSRCLARHFMITLSSSSGRSVRSPVRGFGSSSSTAAKTSPTVSPRNGTLSVRSR